MIAIPNDDVLWQIDREALLSGIALTLLGKPPAPATAKRVSLLLDEISPHLQGSVDHIRKLFAAYQRGGEVTAAMLDQARIEWSSMRQPVRLAANTWL